MIVCLRNLFSFFNWFISLVSSCRMHCLRYQSWASIFYVCFDSLLGEWVDFFWRPCFWCFGTGDLRFYSSLFESGLRECRSFALGTRFRFVFLLINDTLILIGLLLKGWFELLDFEVQGVYDFIFFFEESMCLIYFFGNFRTVLFLGIAKQSHVETVECIRRVIRMITPKDKYTFEPTPSQTWKE